MALAALGAAVVVESIWLATERTVPHGYVYYSAALFDLLFALLLVSRARWRWLDGSLRILIGLNFGLAVLDRFGVLGPYGSPWVGWGDWMHFVAYTRQVNAFLPASFAPALAVIATAYEIALATALVLGIQTRVFSIAAAVLLFIYASAMTISFGFASQLAYAVIVLLAGSVVLATSDATFLSVDAAMKRQPA